MICFKCKKEFISFSKRICKKCRIHTPRIQIKKRMDKRVKTPYNIDANAAFRLVAAVIAYCFNPEKSRDRKAARKFAHSPLLELWCDTSENFEALKLRKLILMANIN